MNTVTLIARFTAKPDAVASVAALLAAFTGTVRTEAGNITFSPYTVEGDRAAFFVYEKYRDRAALESHAASEHTARFTEELVPLIVEDGAVLTFLDTLPLED